VARAAPPEDTIELSIIALALSAPAPLHPIGIGLVVAFLVVSLGVHEAAHGWTALQFGDTTARDLGRITLNPFAHIDLFMTIVLPVMCLLTVGFPFGGAKPVPVNFHALRKPFRDMAMVALAGPLSNLLIAALVFALRHLLVDSLGLWAPNAQGEAVLGDRVLDLTITVNLLLAAFNLLPIPPLDGSRVMTWLLPSGLREAYMRFEAFGLVIVLMLVFTVPAVSEMVWDMMDLMRRGIEFGVTAGGAW